MIERVAKAIFDAMDVTDGLDASSAERYARAAIEAMREPTPEMMGALRFYGMLDGDAEEAWEMTVKTALDPSTPLVGH